MRWGWYEMKSVAVASKSRKNCTVARQDHYRGGDKRGETVGVRTKIIFANAAIPAARHKAVLVDTTGGTILTRSRISRNRRRQITRCSQKVTSKAEVRASRMQHLVARKAVLCVLTHAGRQEFKVGVAHQA
jgi:hypothetical protein